VKQIPRDNNDIWPRRYDTVQCKAKSVRDIGFTLIDACRGLPVVLPDAEMRVRNVGQFHGWRMGLIAVKSKNSTA
jgi:hypothetical protein